MRCGSEAGNHGGFQWEMGYFLWCLHLESKLCCDFHVLKLVEKVLLSSSTIGMCLGSLLQLQYNSAVLAYVSEWLWSVSICFLYMWFDLMFFPTEASHNCLFSFLFWWLPYVLVIFFLRAPPCNLCPFSFHSCLHTFFLSSFFSTKKTLSLHSPLPIKQCKLSQHYVHWKGKWEYREECYRALEMLFCFRF